MPRGLAAALRRRPSREAAVSRPSDHAGPTSTTWPRFSSSLRLSAGARPERDREVLGMPSRCIDRLLEIEPCVDVAQEELRRPLVLLVAAGRAPGEVGLAIAQRHGGRQCGAGPLAGLERRRVV